MSVNLIYLFVARTVLLQAQPNADPAEVTRLSVLSAVLPGTVGLIVPFVAKGTLPELSDGSTTGQTPTSGAPAGGAGGTTSSSKSPALPASGTTGQ